MPPRTQSPAGTARRNVTSIIGRHEALSIDVCRAGSTVAIHCHTIHGVVVLTLAEREFIDKVRGRVDSNGNPFRSLQEIKALAGEAVPPARSAELAQPSRHGDRGVNSQRCATAWEMLKARPDLAAADVAAACGVQANTFSQWISYHHRGELRQLRTAAGLSLRPLRQQAPPPPVDLKAPILKPGGSLL